MDVRGDRPTTYPAILTAAPASTTPIRTRPATGSSRRLLRVRRLRCPTEFVRRHQRGHPGCALARHLGSRAHDEAEVFLWRECLPRRGEMPGDFPMFFHYVNVGPDVQEDEMITDVCLPLK